MEAFKSWFKWLWSVAVSGEKRVAFLVKALWSICTMFLVGVFTVAGHLVLAFFGATARFFSVVWSGLEKAAIDLGAKVKADWEKFVADLKANEEKASADLKAL